MVRNDAEVELSSPVDEAHVFAEPDLDSCKQAGREPLTETRISRAYLPLSCSAGEMLLLRDGVYALVANLVIVTAVTTWRGTCQRETPHLNARKMQRQGHDPVRPQ